MKSMKSGSRTLVSIQEISVPADTYFYDISVTGDHSFKLANGAVSHNCDFDPERRDEIFVHLQGKYGKDKVLKTATWGASGIKGSIQDLSKVVSVEEETSKGTVKTVRPKWKEVQDVTKQINLKEISGELEGEDTTLDWIERNIDGAKELFSKFPELKKWAPAYSPVIRNSGQHAGAVVISSEPLSDYLPIILSSDGDQIIGLSEAGSSGKKELQPQGAIKYDFLGLANIQVLRGCEKLIEQRHGIHFDEKKWHEIGFEHPKVYELARHGELEGIFQFEQHAGRKTTAQVQPQNFGDLVFINAGMRPGAAKAGAPLTYNKHMRGIKDPNYPDYNDLKNYGVDDYLTRFLGETYGVICVRGNGLITTDNGKIPIAELEGKSGIPAPSLNHETMEIELDEIIACWKTGDEEVFEIELEDGTVLPLTENHLVLTERGYVALKNLTLNDIVLGVDKS